MHSELSSPKRVTPKIMDKKVQWKPVTGLFLLIVILRVISIFDFSLNFPSTGRKVPTSLIFGALVLFYVYVKKKHSYWQNMGVPTVPPTFLVGHVLRRFGIGASFNQFYDEVYAQKNNNEEGVSGFYDFLKPGLVVTDIKLIKNFFLKDFECFSQNRSFDLSQVNSVANQMITNSHGEKWQRLRKILSPSFTSHKVRQLYPLIHRQCDGFINKLKTIVQENPHVKTREICGQFTMNTIASCAFGIECEIENSATLEFSQVATRLLSMTLPRAIKIVIMLGPSVLVSCLKKIGVEFVSEEFLYLERVTRAVLKARHAEDIRRGDFLDLMKDSDEEISEDEMTGQAIVFLLAGYQNTANTLSYALHLLAVNPKIQEKLRQEIKNIKDGCDTSDGIVDAIYNSEYLDCVVNETLRLYPVSPTVERRCTKGTRIPGTKISIEEGQNVVCALWNIHRDPQYWEDPECFKPERFIGTRNGASLAFLPFGLGPRICIGKKFSIFVIKIALWEILETFEVYPHENTIHPPPLEPKILSLQTTNGLPLGFTMVNN